MKSYADIAGDGGSNIIGQVVAQKNKIAKNLSAIRHQVAIGSGKGGVGKSTITTQLAAALNWLGHKVALLDADFNGPTQAKISGIQNSFFAPGDQGLIVPQTKEGIGVVSLGALFPERKAIDFESVAQGESYLWRATKEFSLLGDLLANMNWGKLDILLIDLPPGAERTFQFAEYFGQETSFVLVTIPSDVSQGVVARSISALQKTSNPLLGYIENMVGYYCSDCRAIKPLFPSSANGSLNIPRLGQIPFDPTLAKMCDEGISIMKRPDLPSTKVCVEIAKKIWELLSSPSSQPSPQRGEGANRERSL